VSLGSTGLALLVCGAGTVLLLAWPRGACAIAAIGPRVTGSPWPGLPRSHCLARLPRCSVDRWKLD
jgi:hypothetical protein